MEKDMTSPNMIFPISRLWCFCLSRGMLLSPKQPFKCNKSCYCTNFGAFNGPRNCAKTMLCSHETLWHFSTLLGLKVINYRVLSSFRVHLDLWWKVVSQLWTTNLAYCRFQNTKRVSEWRCWRDLFWNLLSEKKVMFFLFIRRKKCRREKLIEKNNIYVCFNQNSIFNMK